jgi:hypothetical protein|tara:strand:+ start:722 stop:1216 length:495 start_codon:yes stop_codon:yes gene_type:complete
MKLEVIRFNKGEDSTNGILFDVTNERKFLCYTLEDESRKEKVYGETCIPEGEYCINFRAEGGYHAKYSKRFADIHMGMLEVCDVPNFKYILIHCGNTDEDTAGCLLVGDTQENNNIKKNGFIGRSTAAYTRIYPDIADALSRGEEVTIEYRDFSTALILDPLSL